MKIFSIFEEHTQWVSKGKAGTPVELGVPVALIEDQHQFILHHRILWQGEDVDAAVPLVRGSAGAASGAAGVQFRPGLSQSRQPRPAGCASRRQCAAGQGTSVESEPGTGGGSRLCGGAARASGLSRDGRGVPSLNTGYRAASGRLYCGRPPVAVGRSRMGAGILHDRRRITPNLRLQSGGFLADTNCTGLRRFTISGEREL